MLVDILCCRFKIGKYGPHKSSREPLLENNADGEGTDQSLNSLYSNNEFAESFKPVNLTEATDRQYRDEILSANVVNQDVYQDTVR